MRQCFTVSLCIFCLVACSISFVSCEPNDRDNLINTTLAQVNSLDEEELAGYVEKLSKADPIAQYYKDERTKTATLGFFATITHSESVAKAILDNAIKFEVPPALAFALALEESDFRIDAINRNGGSVDRGLFQLNSKSYPGLTLKDFYDPATNSRYGVSHLKGCLDDAGNEVAALAMYNAGNGRVARDATPQRTLNYVSRILSYKANIAGLFAAKVMAPQRNDSSPAPGVASLFAESFSMGLLSNSTSGKN